MSTQGLRVIVLLGSFFGLCGGCAGVPPVPSHVNTRPAGASSSSLDNEDGGWLFDRLTGRDRSASREDTSGGVVPTSFTEPSRLPPVAPIAPVAAKPPEDDDGFGLEDLAPENVYKSVLKATGNGPNEAVARALLKDGQALYAQKRYDDAAAKFQSAAKRWPDSVLEEDALFMLGQCYFFTDRYPKAQDTYGNLLKKHDNSRYLDTVTKHLFAIGRYWEQKHEANPHWPVTPNLTDKEQPWFDTFGNAIKAYDLVWMKDPTGPLADDAVMAEATAYFNKGRYEDAAYYYDMLREQFPKSEHQARAHLLCLEAKKRTYQGPFYDGTPLEHMEKIAKQADVQFRGQLGQQRALLAQTRDQIQEQKAARDWAMAQYYEAKNQFGAARHYYGAIIKDFPLTQHARQARARLEAIRTEPDEPPNRFKWLTGMFPSEE